MEIVRSLTADVEPHDLFVHVEDIADYRAWMPLVHDVERLPDDPTSDSPAWLVELRAQVGPFARSKRLRMERTELVQDRVAVFERREADGRQHSEWILRADLAVEESGRTVLTMTMSYDGSLWAGPILERVLDDQVRRGSDRLLELVT
ncbi:MAG: SRPBCC family protein [Ilumatobacter sp.]|uniref:SRPBCC family protein n=1 Tax=Ilumatobacter sp. TaxID=1967498 RepID=UPI0032968E7D